MKALARTICIAAAIAGFAAPAYAVRHYFYASCPHKSHGDLGFNGRRHADAADAQKDCAEHQRIYPRHRCGIKPIDY